MQTADPRVVRSLLREHGQAAFLELALRYGKTFRHSKAVATCDPAVVRSLLMDRAHVDERPKTYKAMGKFPGMDGILFMDGEPWKKRAHALAPVFQRNHAESFGPTVDRTVAVHAAQWRAAGRHHDLYDAVQRLGAATVLAMGYGLDPADEHARRLANELVAYKQFTMSPEPRRRLDRFDTGVGRLGALPWVISGLLKMRTKTKRVGDALDDVIAHGKELDEQAGWLRQLRAAGIQGKELVNEVNHLYFAYNAIDFVITAALVELARRPGWTERLRSELTSALGDRAPSRADLPALRETQAFILEVLRCYPVSMGVVRRTGEAVPVGDDAIAPGTEVMILLYALQHHPEFWGSDARAFNPERWLASPEPPVPYTYVPFLEGPRKCIGRNMAEMLLLVVLAAIVRQFDLRLLSEPAIPPFMIPRYGAPIPFEITPAPVA